MANSQWPHPSGFGLTLGPLPACLPSRWSGRAPSRVPACLIANPMRCGGGAGCAGADDGADDDADELLSSG